MKKTIKMLLSSLVAAVMCVSAYAQFTTSSLDGRVSESDGAPLVGAVVEAVHVPSGSHYYAVANSEGRYFIQGMRPGGPYEVTVSFVGFTTVKYTDINIPLGEVYSQNAELAGSEVLDEVVVVASASKFNTEKTGASTNISNREMNELPSVNRSIEDLTKLSPYANGMSFAGGDGRSTNFTVDGANLNNNFGLKSRLPGGGTPISVDALEEVQMVVAPYDVRQTNFIGGGINAITKSGTNTYKGTAYMYYHNEDLRGNKIAGDDLGERKPEVNRTIGFTVGGPIIKNKLFFFVNFETISQPEQTIKYRAAKAGETGGEGMVSRTTAEDMQKVSDYLKNTYGYSAGSYTDFPGGVESTKILARIDWNISDAHKLSVRFNDTHFATWVAPNGNSCDDGYRNKSYNRSSLESMAFSNNMYSEMNNVWSLAAELNSRIGNNVQNRFIATYTNINDQRGSNSSIFPHIDIMQGPSAAEIQALYAAEQLAAQSEGRDPVYKTTFKPAMSMGYELFSYNNGVKNNVLSVSDNVTYTTGSHKLVAGASFERQTASNSYMRNGTGYYRYASLDDFLGGKMPVSAALCVGNNGEANPRGEITYNQIAAYVQDEWAVEKNFKLTYGLRADMIAYDNSQLMTNKATLGYKMGSNTLDTGKWPATSVQISPRVGFNWDVNSDKTLIVRGGAGVFQGRLPLVFFTNMPQNAGMIQGLYSYNFDLLNPESDTALHALWNGSKVLTTVDDMVKALGINTNVTPEDGQFQNTMNGVDGKFRMPQIAKVSLAADYQVPVSFPLTLTAEAMFTKTLNGVRLVDWNINEDVVMAKNADGSYKYAFAGEDGRINYAAAQSDAGDYTYTTANGKVLDSKNPINAYVLTNTNKGYGYTLALSLATEPVKNLKINASYVHTESKEISGMPGSAASSAYNGLYTVNGPNFATLQRSQYVVPDKLSFNINYFLPLAVFGGNGLHMNLLYTGYSAAGYNYVYANDMNGDGNNADLMYIYKKGADVNFVEHTYTWKVKEGGVDVTKTGATLTAAQQAQAYDKFLAQDKYLSKHAGKYAEANSARAPFVHRFDFRIAEDFSFKAGNTTQNFQLSLSIENIGNMLNSNWGIRKWSCYQTDNSVFNITPLTYAGLDASGKPSFYMTAVDGQDAMPTQSYSKNYVDPSECWQILIGIKYLFN